MANIKSIKKAEARPDIIKSKRLTGIAYGAIGGLAFAVSSWGWDGYVLSQSHAYLPWLSLSVALIFCSSIGAMTGWLTARFENSLLGAIFWLIPALLFAWLIIVLPLQINPFLISKINPQIGSFLNYSTDVELGVRFGVAASWIVPFALIIGVTQLPITESSVFSASFFGKIAPFFFCVVVISLSGVIADNMINMQFRDALVSMNNAVQFTLDNKNNPRIDEDAARQMHASSLNAVKKYVVESRTLLVREYDATFGEIHILIRFENQWVDCLVVYAQPSSCKIAE